MFRNTFHIIVELICLKNFSLGSLYKNVIIKKNIIKRIFNKKECLFPSKKYWLYVYYKIIKINFWYYLIFNWFLTNRYYLKFIL